MDLTAHQLGWIFIGLGVFVLAWSGYDAAAGETHVETSETFFGEAVQKDAEPVRFRRLILTSMIGAFVSIGLGVGLLVVF